MHALTTFTRCRKGARVQSGKVRYSNDFTTEQAFPENLTEYLTTHSWSATLAGNIHWLQNQVPHLLAHVPNAGSPVPKHITSQT